MSDPTGVEVYHVWPIDDLMEHQVEGAPCPCNPVHRYIDDEHVCVVHNAFDGRELSEVGQEQLS